MFKLDLAPDSLNAISVIIGLILPAFVAWVVAANYSRRAKQWAVILVAALGAIAVSVVREGIAYDTVDSFLHSVFIIIGVAQTFYLALWSTVLSGLTKKLEQSTAPGSAMLGNMLQNLP